MSKNQKASGITNIINYDNSGNISFVSGSTTLMSVSSSGAVLLTGTMSGGTADSASLSANSNLLQGTGSIGFATTASLLEVSSSQQQISASLLTLTASYTALSSSYTALSGSYTTFSGSASTRVTQIENTYATTGSNSFRANQSITGSLVVSSTITAQTLVVQTVTSSIVYSSGSNNFGNQLSNNQTFTGSLQVTGSTTLNGGLTGTSASFSGEVTVGSNLVLSAANPYVYGGTSVGGVGISNITGGSYIRVYGASHATLANNTQFVNAGSTSLIISSSGAATFSSTVASGDTLTVNKAKAGSGVENLNALILKLTGTGAIGDGANITFVNPSNIGVAFITGILGADNVAYGSLSFSTRNYNTDSVVEVMRINNRSNVGIGTTNPQAKLHVNGNMIIGSDGAYALISGPTTGAGISIGSNSVTFDRNLHLGLVTAGLSFSPVLTVNAQTGNVGIGTTGPITLLEISATTTQAWYRANRASTSYEAGLQLATGGTSGWYTGLRSTDNANNYHFYSYTTSTSVAQITTSGNLLVGTTTDNGAKAQINGNTYVFGILVANELRIGDVYTNAWTTDASWSSSQIVVPNGVLTSLATYMIEFDWNFNGIGGAPYLSSAATIFRTNSYVNSAGDNNEVALATSSHVGGNYIIYMAMRAAGGSTQAGVSARLSWTPAGSGGVLTVRVKRIN